MRIGSAAEYFLGPSKPTQNHWFAKFMAQPGVYAELGARPPPARYVAVSRRCSANTSSMLITPHRRNGALHRYPAIPPTSETLARALGVRHRHAREPAGKCL